MTNKVKSEKGAVEKLKGLSAAATRSRRAPLVVILASLILIWQLSFGELARSSNPITTVGSENSLSQKSLFEESSLNQVPAMTLRETGNAERTAGFKKDFGLEQAVRALFANLPSTKAFKIWAPATRNELTFLAEVNGQERLFSASANKAYILCERLRQLDSPNLEERLVSHELGLNKDVWSIGSPVFHPPDLSGLVSERTAMEAMITHSDNTATDMILKEAGAGPVRQFIGSIGLSSTMIPDSTRALAGYLLGAPNYLTLTYDELSALEPIFVHPPLNNVETFASSPNDLVSFYQRALEGRFFRNPQTLEQFRRILSLGDIGPLVGFPLGASVFGKAGYFDISGQHARCIAGGMYFHDRWIYFAAILNWNAPALQDPSTVEAFYSALRKALVLVP